MIYIDSQISNHDWAVEFLASRPFRNAAVLSAAALILLSAAGCSAGGSLPETDQRVIDQLAEIAPLESRIDGIVTDVECWQASEHMVDERTFRVLCRVHYDQQGVDRYADMICVGDPTADPVSDYCYRWAHYSDMPVYEDAPGYFAS